MNCYKTTPLKGNHQKCNQIALLLYTANNLIVVYWSGGAKEPVVFSTSASSTWQNETQPLACYFPSFSFFFFSSLPFYFTWVQRSITNTSTFFFFSLSLFGLNCQSQLSFYLLKGQKIDNPAPRSHLSADQSRITTDGERKCCNKNKSGIFFRRRHGASTLDRSSRSNSMLFN